MSLIIFINSSSLVCHAVQHEWREKDLNATMMTFGLNFCIVLWTHMSFYQCVWFQIMRREDDH